MRRTFSTMLVRWPIYFEAPGAGRGYPWLAGFLMYDMTHYWRSTARSRGVHGSSHKSDSIAVFPILADTVEVKKGAGSSAHWSYHFVRLNGWPRDCVTLLIIPLDIDGIGQNWDDSNTRCTIFSTRGSTTVLF